MERKGRHKITLGKRILTGAQPSNKNRTNTWQSTWLYGWRQPFDAVNRTIVMCGGQSIRLAVICLFLYSNLSDTCSNLFSMAIGQFCRDDPTYLPNDSPTVTETYTKWVSLSATCVFLSLYSRLPPRWFDCISGWRQQFWYTVREGESGCTNESTMYWWGFVQ